MFHLRYTPYDISGYTFDFLNKSEYKRYAVAFEDKDKHGQNVQPHYHIYIEADYGIQSIRNDAKDALKIPTAGGRGKNNQYYSLVDKWEDKDYIFKYGDIKKSKGFSQEEINLRTGIGRGKYLKESSGQVLGSAEVKSSAASSRITDKDIIADIVFYYETYRREKGLSPSKHDLVRECIRVLRSYGKGVNPFKVRDYIHAVWWDTEDNREFLVNKISGLV